MSRIRQINYGRVSWMELDKPQECFEGNMTKQLLCASGGFGSLRDYFRVLNASFSPPPQLLRTSFSLNPIVIKSSAPQIPDLQSYGSERGWRGDTDIIQPNMVTSILPSSLVQDWRNSARELSGSPFSAARQYQHALRMVSIVPTTSPIVRIRCTKAQNISTGLNEMRFPIKKWAPTSDPGYWQNNGNNLKPFNVTVLDPKAVNNMHIEWVPLPVESFGPVSGGIFLQFPGASVERERCRGRLFHWGCMVSKRHKVRL